MRKLRAPDCAGANVTIPHKLAVMDQLDRVDAEALRARAVQTIAKEGDLLIGSNTDVAAIGSAIAEVGVDPRGADVVILGGGGSARAAAVALEGAHLTFVVRRPSDVDVPGRVLAWDDPDWPGRVRAADLLVNATPLGRRDEMPLRPNALPREGSVVDLVYVKGGTPLVRKARSLGLRAGRGRVISCASCRGPRPVVACRGTSRPRDVRWRGRAAIRAAVRLVQSVGREGTLMVGEETVAFVVVHSAVFTNVTNFGRIAVAV